MMKPACMLSVQSKKLFNAQQRSDDRLLRPPMIPHCLFVRARFRCLSLHWHHLPLLALLALILVINVRMKLLVAQAWELSAYVLISATILLWLGAVVAWSLDATTLVDKLFRSLKSGTFGLRKAAAQDSGKSGALVMTSETLSPNLEEGVTAQNSPAICCGTFKLLLTRAWEMLSKTPSTISSVTKSRSSSKHIKLQFLLGLVHALAISPIVCLNTLILVWALRLSLLAFILCIDDLPGSFEDMKARGAGYGLLLRSSHARRAIRAFLNGEEDKGRLLKTHGSFYRMSDTMTVSYRYAALLTSREPYWIDSDGCAALADDAVL